MKSKVYVKTKYGKGFIDEIWISELGFLMVKINLGDRWVSFNLGKHDIDNNMFTNLIGGD